ncbi:hypothetical protein GR160_07650 [Flavobacterium sp. Sd200]|nr:hypothetical protein [Flavobacterium sp. Sd200]
MADRHNRIAFQVTSSGTSKKIKDTVASFIKHGLYEHYDQLFILVLGKKQQRYPVVTSNQVGFNAAQHILDFKDLFKQISFMPSAKLKQLARLIDTKIKVEKQQRQNAATTLKRSLAIKKKIQKELVKKDLAGLYDRLYYEPDLKFIYGRLMVRSADDRLYPDVDRDKPMWYRMELWDFYDYGLEFINNGCKIIFDKEYNWDYLEEDDPRISNPDYRYNHFHGFARISYDDMVEYDPETDGYYGYSSLFCHFRHNDRPIIEVSYGTMGDYSKRHLPFRFEVSKYKKLP